MKPPSTLERKFILLWRDMGGPDMRIEHKFHPQRKWKMDFALIKTNERTGVTVAICIECEGGTYSGGRHTRGSGFQKDALKYLEATFMGWTVFRLTARMVNAPTLKRIKEYIEEQLR